MPLESPRSTSAAAPEAGPQDAAGRSGSTRCGKCRDVAGRLESRNRDERVGSSVSCMSGPGVPIARHRRGGARTRVAAWAGRFAQALEFLFGTKDGLPSARRPKPSSSASGARGC
jgi:hypothetical protein